ncbi:MAG: phosphoribosylamine--glycine ligase [Bryobacteraceae bacterium]
MRVLIIGGGGREHALAWKLSQSPLISKIYASPGNPGIAAYATCLDSPAEITGWVPLAQAHGVNLTIVGPEAPLVEGIVDHFRRRRLWILGPSRAAARLEGSKIFAKQFFERTGIPTARSIQATSTTEALDALKHFGLPVVIKADGLAGGKGVDVAATEAEAKSAIDRLGPNLVVEEFLEGEEVSLIGLTNGPMFLPFAPCQDHKRLLDDDLGPNTGGMGAYCDRRILTSAEQSLILERIMLPAIRKMQEEGYPFAGFLYGGLMMTAYGPKVLEFNVRLGDPEAQALLHSYSGDFAELLNMVVTGTGGIRSRPWSQPSVCVVLAAAGYPGGPRSGDPITGIEKAEGLGAKVFQAGTARSGDSLVTHGGRILGVTTSGETLQSAIDNAYRAAAEIHFDGMQYRKDIGQKGLSRW